MRRAAPPGPVQLYRRGHETNQLEAALARAVVDRARLSEEQARPVLQCFAEEAIETLLRDVCVRLGRIGVLELRVRKSRRARNPRTGEKVSIPDKVCARFRPGPALKQALEQQPPVSPAADGTSQGEGFARPWWQFWR